MLIKCDHTDWMQIWRASVNSAGQGLYADLDHLYRIDTVRMVVSENGQQFWAFRRVEMNPTKEGGFTEGERQWFLKPNLTYVTIEPDPIVSTAEPFGEEDPDLWNYLQESGHGQVGTMRVHTTQADPLDQTLREARERRRRGEAELAATL